MAAADPGPSWTPALMEMGWTGWVVSAAYVAAAGLCFRSSRTLSRDDPRSPGAPATSLDALRCMVRGMAVPPNRRVALLWLFIVAALAILAFNRLLGLDTLVTGLLRNLARNQGWYDDRRGFQIAALTILVGGTLLALPLGRTVAGGGVSSLELRLALAGSILLLGYTAVKACSFHDVDALLGSPVAGFRLGGIVEFALIVGVAVAAFRFTSRIVRIHRAARAMNRV